ncbi:MAG: prephenate dehydrogenase/arogenate dehydrogenase family protein [Patescibacteria group bacterium]
MVNKNLKDKNNPYIVILGGNGKFGSWFVNFFKKEGLTVKALGRADEKETLIEVKKADIVIVSVPISVTASVIKKIREQVRPEALLCDFTSIKEFPLKEMMKTKSGCGVVGIHPMFGPLVTSLKNQSIVFCPGRDNHWVLFLKDLFKKRGARLIESPASEHDKNMAIVQALTHFINILFGVVLSKHNTQQLNLYSSPVFRLQSILSARVLGGKANLYAEIAIQNPAFRKTLNDLDKEYKKLSSTIKEKNLKSYIKIYEQSAKALESFIPLAQTASMEIFNIADRQSFVVSQAKKYKNQDLKKQSIFVLGPEGTFSHLAAKNIFDRDNNIEFCTTIREVFEYTLNSDLGTAVVPIENSTQGIVQESLDCFTKFPLVVAGSYRMPIHLHLFSRAKDLSAIKVIKSHPQPLAQAKEWLRINLPDVILEPVASSAKAILETKDKETAFIGSLEAARKYKLNILVKNIEDKKNNSTEFYIITKADNLELLKSFKTAKTALILLVHNRPGILNDILNSFATRSINLTKLHSKSSDLEDCDYYFFLELEGNLKSKNIQSALAEIDKYCYIKRVLGQV